MYFEEDQELLYGSASDIEDLMEDQGTAGPSEMMDDEIEEDY